MKPSLIRSNTLARLNITLARSVLSFVRKICPGSKFQVFELTTKWGTTHEEKGEKSFQTVRVHTGL